MKTESEKKYLCHFFCPSFDKRNLKRITYEITTEVVAQRCPVKKVFLEILQN